MGASKPSLLEPVVAEDKLYDKFKFVRSAPQAACARAMLNDIYEDFTDPDGNFVEQFQTTGFDSRYFEFYLFAYLSRSGYAIDRSYPFPDFIVERDGARVAIEATTTNPSTSGALKGAKKIGELTPAELADYARNELAIRFGGPLQAKLRKRYWEQSQCAGIPVVLAIATFHDEEAFGMTDSALMRYVYGSTTIAEWSSEAELHVSSEKVEKHATHGKEIPSHFFAQPDTENISAILFTNSGTHPKFSRMGYQHGYETEEIEIFRFGRSFTMDEDAKDPTYFSYKLSEPPVIETWGQGISVMLNPNARYPLPKDFFVDAVQCYEAHGRIVTEHRAWHPFTSKTAIAYYNGAKKELAKMMRPLPPMTEVRPIKREEFRHIVMSHGGEYSPSDVEDGWYADAAFGFLGVLLREEDSYRMLVYARDEYFKFFKLAETSSVGLRELAVEQIQLKIADLMTSPQRVFPQRRKSK